MKGRTAPILSAVLLLAISCSVAGAVERFPPPEFDTDYTIPSPTTPPPRADLMEYVDLLVLLLALGVGSYLVLRKRRRRWLFGMMLVSLGYFGFYREGCVCAIGSIQNVSIAIFDGGHAIPLTVLGFFLLPLIFTLLFGRIFCASVCPFGAIQDVVLLKPVKVPDWLGSGLSMLAWAVLAGAVLFAATGSAFIICQYDPFVWFFRLGADVSMLIAGACVLLIAVFVGRPYCRYLCPLGALMRPLSKVSKFRVTITPDECIKCRLCEDSCPFGAIHRPTEPLGGRERDRSRRRLAALLVLGPVLVAAGVLLAHRASPTMARMNYTVRLAEQVRDEEAGRTAETTDSSNAFRKTGRSAEWLYAAADAKRRQFAWGAAIAGGFLGLVFAGKLIALCLHRTRADYEPVRSHCLACGRCFEYCPVEKQRRMGKPLQLKEEARVDHGR